MDKRQFPGWLLLLGILSMALPTLLGASPDLPNSIEAVAFRGKVGSEEVERMVASHLQRIVNDHRKRIEVKDLHEFPEIDLPAGYYSCEILLPEQASRGGNISGTLVFRSGQKEIKRFRITARVEIYADVVSARHYLQRHSEIQEKDIQLVNKNISPLPLDVITDLSEVAGKRTVLSINPQEVLRKSMIEIPPIVKKGDRVILLVENEQFRITTLGEAKEDGRRGDRVKLVNYASKKEVHGKVLDGSTVQVDF